MTSCIKFDKFSLHGHGKICALKMIDTMLSYLISDIPSCITHLRLGIQESSLNVQTAHRPLFCHYFTIVELISKSVFFLVKYNTCCLQQPNVNNDDKNRACFESCHITASHKLCIYFDFLNAPCPDMSDVATLCVSTR